jgi:pimeloyl-ACP methyl ester carboxylesterase
VVGEMLNMLLAADDASYAYACEALAGYDLTERLGEIEPPVLVISGEQDPVATPAQAQAMADAITNNTYIEVFGVSHQAGTEAPEVVAKHINHFVRMYR